MKKIATGIYRFDWNTDTGCSAGTGGYLCCRACRREQYRSVGAADPGVRPRLVAVWDKESRRIKDKRQRISPLRS